MPITAIRSMPTLDVTKLSPTQLATAEEIFEDMRDAQFLPANEAYPRQHAEGAGPSRPDRRAGAAGERAGAAVPAQAEVVLGAKCPRGQEDGA